ncbi:DNA-directed RNA polymerase subunit omega [bacterium]|nr:DNA-directed RNA polymerase subunit omega [bacterium]MBU1983275.1 DNA-directed RNA polymerase subunit omega [bacterium]
MRAEEYFPEHFLGRGFNIYEVVLIIAQRARQVGEIQKRQIDRHLGQTEMLEQAAARARAEESDDVYEPEPIDRPVPKFDKPVILAMEEMRQGNTKFEYEE